MVAFSRWLWTQRSGVKVSLAVLAALLLPLGFNPLVERFVAETSGLMPFDMQFVLTPADMREQVLAWTPEAVSIYHWFALLDFVFPPAFSLGFALSWAWLLARLPGDVGERAAQRGLLALAFLPAIFDWFENLGTVLFVHGHEAALYVSLGAKVLKQTGLMVELGVTLVLIALALRARR